MTTRARRLRRFVPLAMFACLLSTPFALQAQTWRSTATSMGTGRWFHTATLLPTGQVLVAGGVTLVAAVPALPNSAELFSPATGVWAGTDTLTTARWGHTATLLQNGKVLVVGGTGTGGVLPSAELYDPATGTWTNTGSLNVARATHTATLLPDGRVLVAGGSNTPNVSLASAELYDPSTGGWTLTTNAMTTTRRLHAGTLLANGHVLVTGGLQGAITPLATAETFNPATGAWAATANPMVGGRGAHTATRLPDGKVLVAGGSNGVTAQATAQVFDPAGGTWTATANTLATARALHTASLLPTGKVLAVGGASTNTIEVYDPSTNTWSGTVPIGFQRFAHAATLLSSGKVLVVGGLLGGTALTTAEIYDPGTAVWDAATGATGRFFHTQTLLPSGQVLVAGGVDALGPSAELRDPTTGAWTSAGSLGAPRIFHTATLLNDGRVLVAGGDTSDPASAQLFDPASGTWAATGSMSTGRGLHTATLLPDGRVLVAGGGLGSSGSSTATSELFDPATGLWTPTGNLVAARVFHTATLLPNGKVLAVGGGTFTSSAVLGTAELFDPATGVWTATNSLATARIFHTATLLPSGKVLVAGGQDTNDVSLAANELFDPATETWSPTAGTGSAREHHTATLLPSGQVLFAGGRKLTLVLDNVERFDPAVGLPTTVDSLGTGREFHTASLLADGSALVVSGASGAGGGSLLTSAERFDPMPGIDPSWRPSITAATPPMPGAPLVLTGTGFQGVSEASGGGTTNNSSSNYPLVQLYRLDNGQIAYLRPAASSWSDTSITTVPVAGIHPGPALLTVFTNGIPSASRMVAVQTSCPVITVTPTGLGAGVTGQAYAAQTLGANGAFGPPSFGVTSGALPPGMSLAGGTLVGTPTTKGSFGFTVTATDQSGCTGSRSYTMAVHAPPTVSITSPTTAASFGATTPFLALAGVAADDVGVAAVTWKNNQGGSGPAAGTTTWNAPLIPLQPGTNVLTVTATDTDGASASATLTVTVSQLLYYLAEGATGPFFDLDLLLGNPNGVPAPITVTYLREDGSTVVQNETLTASSERTIRVNDVPGLATGAVSTIVSSDNGLPLVVERSMLWDAGAPAGTRPGGADGPGLTPGATYYGGHTAEAVTSPQTQWLFAEGSENTFDTYLLLANTNATPTPATVTYLVEGGPPIVQNVTVGATSRLTLFAGAIAELVGQSFGIRVTSTLPIIAERAMYFGSGRFWEGGHESAGVPAASTTWFHAEGATGDFFDTFILVSNPGGTVANLSVTYLLATGATVVKGYPVPANGRITINVEAQDPALADAAVSTTVSSDVPVISERAMYWTGGVGTWYEAHNSFGVTATGTRWGLAEGRVGAPLGYETFILLANPTGGTANVQITYLRTTGTTITKTYTVPPTSRFNVWVNVEVPELVDESFGAVIEVTNGVGIAVERALYWSGPGLTWTGGTNATAVRLP